MATGPADSCLLEVAFDGSTYVDVTTRLVVGPDGGWEPVVIRQGRSGRYDDIQPGTMTLTLDNSDGALTPDNPTSTYYPNWREDRPIRFEVTKGATTSRRFWGRISSIEPESPDGVMSWSRVRVTAVDAIGLMTRRKLRAEQVERALYRCRSLPETHDIFPMDRTASAGRLPNISPVSHATARIVQSNYRVGTASIVSTDGINVESALSLTASDRRGPVAHISIGTLGSSGEQIVIPFRTAETVEAGGSDKYLIWAKKGGTDQWSLRLKHNAGVTDLMYQDAVYDVAAISGFAGADGEGDDQWYAMWLSVESGTSVYRVVRMLDDTVVASGVLGFAAVDPRDTTDIWLGGRASVTSKGKQDRCVTAQYAAVVIGDTGANYVGTAYLSPAVTEGTTVRLDHIGEYSGYSIVGLSGGGDVPTVGVRATYGRTAFDCLAEVCRTLATTAYGKYGAAVDAVRFRLPSAMRPTAVSLTVDCDVDLDASGGFPWRRGLDTRPTVVTVSWQEGTTAVYGSGPVVVEDSVDTCAADEDAAKSVGSMRTNATAKLSLEQLTVDLANTGNDLWSATLALELGVRIRLSNLPSTYYGWTYADVYPYGWTEEWDQQRAKFTFDTEPADAPPEGYVDDATYGRTSGDSGTATVTSGTAVGTTGTGTMVVTTSSGPALSNAAGDYPQDFDWNGERVTVTAAPAAAASPQTLTITARGVAPSVARSHSAGEPITPWLQATATL